MKKLLATILFVLTLVFNVYAFDKNQMHYNVYDETNTLSQETIDYLNKTTYDLKKKTGGEIGVVLVKSLEGNSLEEYATNIFNDIGIGDKDKNNGVLILVALLDDENKLVKIETGYGAEGFVPDAYASRIIRAMGRVVAENENDRPFEKAVLEGYAQIIKLYEGEYGVDIVAREPQEAIDYSDDDYREEDPFLAIFKLIVIIAIISLIFRNKNLLGTRLLWRIWWLRRIRWFRRIIWWLWRRRLWRLRRRRVLWWRRCQRKTLIKSQR